MEEIFSVHAEFADRCVESLLPIERQCGALFLIAGRVVGFDLFDRASTLRHLLPKLVRSVAVDAVDKSLAVDPAHVGRSLSPRSDSRKSDRRQPSVSLVTKVSEHFLSLACAAEVHEMPAVGLGRDVRLFSRVISGAALSVDGSLLHLSAFHN